MFHCSFSQFNKKDPSEKWYVRLNFPGLLDGLDQNLSTGWNTVLLRDGVQDQTLHGFFTLNILLKPNLPMA